MQIVLFSLLCCSYLDAVDYTVIKDTSGLKIETPSMQDRTYLKVRLENGLEAYLISDPDANKSGAALSVKVGSLQDPPNRVGMAHFLEHMLFMGNEKYPDENDFSAYIRNNGGMSNAFTATDMTDYMFEVNNTAFEGALDRFAQFFIHPLFNPSSVDREMHAVDQEFDYRSQHDVMRGLELLFEMSNPESPFNTWHCGNYESLQKIDRSELIEWYHAHYSANLMRLVVISTLPIQELTDLVAKEFSPIKNYDYPVGSFPEPLFIEKNKGSLAYVEPLSDVRRITIFWELSEKYTLDPSYKTASVASFLLNNQGPDSLYHALKEADLIEDIAADPWLVQDDKALFLLDIQLTDKGLKHVNSVIAKVFSAINTYKNTEIPAYITEEMQKMATWNYAYQSRMDTFSTLKQISSDLMTEDLASYPKQTIAPEDFSSRRLQQFFALLKPEDALYQVMAKPSLTGVQLTEKTQLLDVSYAIETLPKSLLNTWAHQSSGAMIAVPKPNPYIPEQINLLYAGKQETEVLIPKKIADDAYSLAYFAPDHHFQVPKVFQQYYINSPSYEPTLFNAVAADCYLLAVNYALAPQTFLASFAGINTAFAWDRALGLSLNLYGFSPKMGAYCKELLNELQTLKPSPQQFASYVDELRNSYANAAKQDPYKQALRQADAFVYKNYFSPEEKLTALQNFTYKDFVAYIANMYDTTYLRALLYGNLTEEDALKQLKEIRSFSGKKAYSIHEQHQVEVIDLSTQKYPLQYAKNIHVVGNAMLLLMSDGPFSFKDRAMQSILGTFCNDPYFDSLRTRQQTGYLVTSFSRETYKQLFSMFLVQSSVYPPESLLVRTDVFRQEFLINLVQDSAMEQKFNEVKASELQNLEQPPQNLIEMGARFSKEAFELEADFSWFDKRIDAMKQVTFSDFCAFAYKYFSPTNPMRIAILLTGQDSEKSVLNYYPIDNIASFKGLARYETQTEVLHNTQ